MNNISTLPVVAAISFLGAMLTGCSNSGSDIHSTTRTKVDIPAAMFSCADSIANPTGDIIMESQVARYINSLEFVKKDCKMKLKEVQILINCHNDSECKLDELVKTLTVASP